MSTRQTSTSHVVKLLVAKREIKQDKFIKYLGLHINSHLSWKFHILHIKRCIGIIVYCLLFIVLFAKNYTNQIKSNYLNSHGEEAQEKPPGL